MLGLLRMPTDAQRLAGGVYGLLIGDALGVPYEFHPPGQLPPLEQLEFEPPPGFPRAHAGIPPGTWSDDGAQANCLLASLLDRGQVDVEDLGRRLVSWYERGYMAVDHHVFDVGIQTRNALAEFRSGTPWHLSGPRGERDNGNGALMRVLPLALWHTGTDEALVADAMRQSLVTHGHLRSQVCCALYCLWARRTLKGGARPWDEAVAVFHRLFPLGTAVREELETYVRPHSPEAGQGSGYVVDCLLSARDCLRAGATYEQVVKAAVALGHDTDTTAAVAGGIAGIREGVEAIPGRWRAALRGRDAVEPLVTALLELRCRTPSGPRGG
jgi:ADP-ribosyl-[dinitrogen reductase] hydrolase